jgi:hypothetical protein
MVKKLIFSIFLTFMLIGFASCDEGISKPGNALKVVIIRHGEKPESGDNLSCQGENRALQLSAILFHKFKQPDFTYVPSLKMDKSTTHSRMMQTVTPFAVKYNLNINSIYDEKDYAGVASSVLKDSGTVLMVWEHSAIPDLASALGVKHPPHWKDADFDSIWVITYVNGKAVLTLDSEGINPAAECQY